MRTTSKASSKQAVQGVMWTYTSYYSGKLLVFLSTIILARLLSQDDFGVAGYAIVVINSLKMLGDFGVGEALIYLKKDPKATDTAFWLSVVISSLLFAATWLSAPLLGSFFEDPRAVPVTRALSFAFPLNAMGYMHDMLLRKKLSFKRKFVPDLSRSITKGLFSILFAFLGYGAWSLIYGQLIGAFVASIVFWVMVPWRPSFYFSKDLARQLLRFGINIVTINTLSVLLNNSDAILIGRYLGAAALGVYTLAFRIPDMLVMQFNGLVSRVIFPFYAKMREDKDTFKRGFLYTTKYTVLTTLPMGVGIAVIARPLILTLFGDKWIEAIPVMQALATYTVVVSLVYNAGDVYKAQGRPEILTRLTFLEGTLLLPAFYLILTTRQNLAVVAWARVAVGFVVAILDLLIASRMLKVTLRELFKTIAPALGAALLMALIVSLALTQVGQLLLIAQLLIGIAIGGAVYLGAIWFLQRELLLDGYKMLQKAMVRG